MHIRSDQVNPSRQPNAFLTINEVGQVLTKLNIANEPSLIVKLIVNKSQWKIESSGIIYLKFASLKLSPNTIVNY